MSADTVIVPAAGSAVPKLENNLMAYDAVDTFEITARLEASGLSDRTVRQRHGAKDVFDYASSLVQERGTTQATAEPWLGRDDLLQSVRRAIVLILGAVLGGLTATVLAANTREVLVAGIGAWIIGQAVSGIVWTYAGAGQLKRGVARGTGATLLIMAVLACYVGVSLILPGHDATMAALLMVWCWYSCVVSMLVILGRSWFLLTVLACAVSIVATMLALRSTAAAVIMPGTALLVVAAVTALLAIHLRSNPEGRRPRWEDGRSAVAPAAQAGFLAAALTLALTRLPAWEGTALVAATVVAAAATDPALVLMRQRLQWSSQRTPLLRNAAWNAWLLTLAISATIVVISAAVSSVVVLFLVEDNRAAATVVVAAIFSALATISTALSAFGQPRRGVLFAAAACLAAALWLLVSSGAGILAAAAFLLAGIVVLLALVADPRTYA
ncbi:hypothetical protein LJ753_01355 [Arthrobacter sp. zg-Y20]|uniref:hypothetical protein n=1 Tax=unclassified Arthrobacter TaxID=235627 RepID=UPI001D1579C1|nr:MULTISPECIES: hypothetical protein [unclassified Arthrobacter]MCC3274516.1 hypothetical protein [Arthrobacter sp. zg-Y20]MDK1314673.1 hypothetical protein [Arthrobacter sp. zg.Y20]WIB07653.1 hypothetical protein QNO06_08105 [Arthrobacter sp. zg-Y20]